MNINEFSTGDIITRSEPSIEIIEDFDSLLGIPTKKGIPYFDQIGERLIFKGVKHNTAYFDAEFGSLKVCVHPDYHVDWTGGWELYEGPFEELKPLNDLIDDEKSKKEIYDFLKDALNMNSDELVTYESFSFELDFDIKEGSYDHTFQMVDFIRSIGYESKTAQK